jgi:tRNA dimethylallyltransferase
MRLFRPLIVVVGPTAVGKTEASLQLAENLNGEIVSADSRLFYRGLDIGTAKPSPEERQRVPHHLIDILDPDQVYSLAEYKKAAQLTIQHIHARGCLPFLVGGTGQYIQAVIQGWDIPRVEPNYRLRGILERWATQIGKEGLHARLAILDPQAALHIDYRNLRRTVRALEVIFLTGRRFSEQGGQIPSPYDVRIVGLIRPRAELYKRIDDRVDAMFNNGLVEEVNHLIEAGISPDASAFSAIGYREVIAYLSGKSTLEEAKTLVKRATRILVRRQANWFKLTDPSIAWYPVDSGLIEALLSDIHQWIASIAHKH